MSKTKASTELSIKAIRAVDIEPGMYIATPKVSANVIRDGFLAVTYEIVTDITSHGGGEVLVTSNESWPVHRMFKTDEFVQVGIASAPKRRTKKTGA